jgi:hypothetical protein
MVVSGRIVCVAGPVGWGGWSRRLYVVRPHLCSSLTPLQTPRTTPEFPLPIVIIVIRAGLTSLTATPRWPGSWGFMSAGAAHLSHTVGRVWFEVEVLEATGHLRVGFAGTNFRGTEVGGDATLWALFQDGGTRHGSAPPPPTTTTTTTTTTITTPQQPYQRLDGGGATLQRRGGAPRWW